MIYILTGDIRTGKTTTLLNWLKDRKDVDGLLCPDDDNGSRYFLKIKSNTSFPLEVKSRNENDVIAIGPFQFLKSAFKEARDYLIKRASEIEHTYLIIDELGKLELKNIGLHVAAETLIPDFKSNDNQHLILVVRSSLLDDIIKHYTIQTYTIITKDDLESLL